MKPENPGVEFVAHPEYLEAVASGPYGLSRLKEQAAEAVRECGKRKKSRLLFDLTAVTGTMSFMDRYKLGAYGAEIAVAIKVAVLAKAEMIDDRKIGIQVAQNRGLRVDIFADRDEALRWLRRKSEEPS